MNPLRIPSVLRADNNQNQSPTTLSRNSLRPMDLRPYVGQMTDARPQS
jgi:hypothetical protein